MNDAKPVYKSRMIIFNLLYLVIAVAAFQAVGAILVIAVLLQFRAALATRWTIEPIVPGGEEV